MTNIDRKTITWNHTKKGGVTCRTALYPFIHETPMVHIISYGTRHVVTYQMSEREPSHNIGSYKDEFRAYQQAIKILEESWNEDATPKM